MVIYVEKHSTSAAVFDVNNKITGSKMSVTKKPIKGNCKWLLTNYCTFPNTIQSDRGCQDESANNIKKLYASYESDNL